MCWEFGEKNLTVLKSFFCIFFFQIHGPSILEAMRRDAAADAAAAAAAAGANYTGGEGGIAGNGTDFGFSEEQMEVGIKHNASFSSSSFPFFGRVEGVGNGKLFSSFPLYVL